MPPLFLAQCLPPVVGRSHPFTSLNIGCRHGYLWADIGPFRDLSENLRGGSDSKIYMSFTVEKLYGSHDGGVHWKTYGRGAPWCMGCPG